MILTRLRHAWLVLTGKLTAIDHSIIAHIDLTKSDLTQDLKELLVSLQSDLANLGNLIDAKIAATTNDAANSLAAAHAEAQASTAKANDLQAQLDAATADVAALAAKYAPPAPVAVDPNAVV